MILVDSSAWIDFLASRETPWTDAVADATRDGEVVVGDLVLAEVLQGFRIEHELTNARRVLRMFPQRTLCDPSIAEDAAANFRLLRRRGLTIRGTIDVIIATWCLRNDASIIHNDRDLAVMERELGLVSYTG
ncbi:type II toxin-antitoxin system VapC family toxin [Aureimonas leprariae]|uniref:PIN domain nuclease n=1 Tax=Plantimonas leprariae TaxID=2615207 RepID=A0A7V7U0L3_9HYPH|nr:PIN domain nuclease [Aureimonas leprariae]KAB0680679.1 PIN domain nuclease [Aureimonas leprariae]